jgi:hypothetical protein
MADPFFAMRDGPARVRRSDEHRHPEAQLRRANSKFNLYNGYLYSILKRRRLQFAEIAENYQRKITTAEKIKEEDLKKIRTTALRKRQSSGTTFT